MPWLFTLTNIFFTLLNWKNIYIYKGAVLPKNQVQLINSKGEGRENDRRPIFEKESVEFGWLYKRYNNIQYLPHWKRIFTIFDIVKKNWQKVFLGVSEPQKPIETMSSLHVFFNKTRSNRNFRTFPIAFWEAYFYCRNFQKNFFEIFTLVGRGTPKINTQNLFFHHIIE